MSDSAETTAVLTAASQEKAISRAAWALEEARRQGADGAEIAIQLAQGFTASVRNGDVETVEYHRDRGVGISVLIGDSKGNASSTDDSEESLRDAIAAACAIARHTQPDPHAALAEPALLCPDIADLDLYHPWPMSVDQAIEKSLVCERAARTDSRIVNSEGASLSSSASMRLLATSNGFLGSYRSTHHSLSCAVLAQDDNGMQTGHWYDTGRRGEQLADAELIGRTAQQEALGRLGAQIPETGNYPVILAPRVAAGFFGHLLAAISGGAIYRRSSFLLDALGEVVLPSWMSLSENPLLPAGNGSSPFDQDGLARQQQSFVEHGILKKYALSLYAARRLAMTPTGNGGGVRNVTVSNSGDTQKSLMAQVPRGILVTDVMGQGVNTVTGDYSRGAGGFYFENGEILYPVHEFTLAGELRSMLASIAGSATDVDRRGNIMCGSLLLPEVKVAGR